MVSCSNVDSVADMATQRKNKRERYVYENERMKKSDSRGLLLSHKDELENCAAI